MLAWRPAATRLRGTTGQIDVDIVAQDRRWNATPEYHNGLGTDRRRRMVQSALRYDDQR
jgi:hypothetical protein